MASPAWSLATRARRPAHDQSTQPRVTVPCLSLQQPFATLLLDGVKTLETRERPLLTPFEGERMLVRIGGKPWTGPPPTRRPRADAPTCTLVIAGAVTIGRTRRLANAELVYGKERVAAEAGLSVTGGFITEVFDAEWFPSPLKADDNTDWRGVQQVSVPARLLTSYATPAEAPLDSRPALLPASLCENESARTEMLSINCHVRHKASGAPAKEEDNLLVRALSPDLIEAASLAAEAVAEARRSRHQRASRTATAVMEAHRVAETEKWAAAA